MPRTHHRRDLRTTGRINMTPMIDVTFLLLTFFMLTSHFASAEKTEVDLPRPDNNQAVDRRIPDRIILNVLHQGPEREPVIMLGSIRVDSIRELDDRLGELAGERAAVQVLLRADRRLGYGHVRRVMEVVARHNLSRLQVVTELDRE